MRIEAALAIIIGILLGLGVTYGIYQVRNAGEPASPTSETNVPTTQISPASPTSTEKILITSPEDESVLTAEQITISGSAESNQMIVFFVNERNYVTQADEIGAFAVRVNLDVGSNIIKVSAISADGTQHEKELVVIRENSTAQLPEEEASSSAKSKSTPSSTPRSSSVKSTVTPTSSPRVTTSPKVSSLPVTPTPVR